MDSDALITIEETVTRFLLKYGKPSTDYTQYMELACQCVQDFHLYDSEKVRTEKVSVNANRWIEMPDDMLRFIDLLIYRGNGVFWSFTMRNDMVNTTTFTGLVEGRDSDEGEAVDIPDAVTTTYGAKGAVNDYNYLLDWTARRVYVDGLESDEVVLKYVSSGISTDATTEIPAFIVPMIDSYLLWRETYWIKDRDVVKEKPLREREYVNEKLKIRNLINSMSYSQWMDVLWGSMTQSPKR